MKIPAQITRGTYVHRAYLYMTDEWASSWCAKTPLRLYTTGPIKNSTTWNHQPAWSSRYSKQNIAFGY